MIAFAFALEAHFSRQAAQFRGYRLGTACSATPLVDAFSFSPEQGVWVVAIMDATADGGVASEIIA